MQVICALTLRDLDFVAEFDGKPVHSVTEVESVDEYDEKYGIVQEWGKKKTIEGHRAYQVRALLAMAVPSGEVMRTDLWEDIEGCRGKTGGWNAR